MGGTIDITCPHCLQTLEADESLGGETVACPGCGREFRVEERTCNPAPSPRKADEEPSPRRGSMPSKAKSRIASRRNAARRPDAGTAGSATGNRRNKKLAWIIAAVSFAVLAAVVIFCVGLSSRKYKRGYVARGSVRRTTAIVTEDQRQIAGLICAAARRIEKDTKNAKYITEKCGETSPAFLFVMECAFRRETIERLAEWIGRMSSQTGPGPDRVEQAWQLLAKSGSANAFRTLLDSAFVDGADSPVVKAFSNNEDGIRDSLCRSAKNWADTCGGSIELVFEACRICGLDTTGDSSFDRMVDDAVASSICAELDEAIEFSTPFFGTPEHAVRILYEIVEGREFDVHSRIKPNGKWIVENLPNSALSIPGAARSVRILLENACSELRKNGISNPSLVRRMVADGLTGTLADRREEKEKNRRQAKSEKSGGTDSGDDMWDSDADGMPDVWEKKFGLDPFKDDSALDSDSDGFSNFEEFRASTDPKNDQNYPPRVAALRVRSIDAEPFPFSFDGVKMKGADGSYKFTVKDATGRDWYVKKDQELANTGFVLKDYSSVVEERVTSTGIRKMEVFTLVFGKNGEQIVMEAGIKPDFCFYRVTFVCGKDVYEVYLNDKFDLDGDTFKLMSVDQETRTAKLECESNKKVVEIPVETNRIRSWNWD